jgi:uncharacterized RDD family membrane protein YckC
MDKPDFTRYSESQLRQILTRIDRERYPERVEEIEARLAQFDAEHLSRPDVNDEQWSDAPPEIAGFWRRAGAFLVDGLVLGVVGFLLGLFLQNQFEAMGSWGRAVGFAISMAYFGIMESRIFQGATFGKRALDIEVVTTNGIPLGLKRALLRAAVFWVPYFLSNAALGDGPPQPVLLAIQGLLVFGLGGAIVYLCIFNRRTRQSVHDLVAGAIVVRAQRRGMPRILPVWRGHIAVAAALCVVAVGGAAYTYSMLGKDLFQPLLLVQQQVSRLPTVRNASVFQGTGLATGAPYTHFMTINAVTRSQAGDEEKLARDIADTAFAAYPPIRQLDAFSVTLTHGYDIGIGSKWKAQTFNFPPDATRTGHTASK